MAQKTEAPLYCRRPGDARPLAAYFLLDLEKGTWSTVTRGQGDGVSACEWHGHVQAFHTSEYLSQAGIDAILADEKVQALAKVVLAGYESRWDGNNNVGRLTTRASIEAAESLGFRIQELSENEGLHVAVWHARDWLSTAVRRTEKGYVIDGVGTVTAKMSDEDLARLVQRVEAAADHEGVVLDPGPEKYLEDLRLRAEE